MKLFFVYSVVLTLLMGNTVWAEEKGTVEAFPVMVVVMDSVGEAFMQKAQNAIVKNLETASDIRIVEARELADYAMLVVPTPGQESEGGKAFGLFIVVTSPFRAKDFDSYMDRAKLDLKKNTGLIPFRVYVTQLDEIIYLGYQVGQEAVLEQTCREIVKTFEKNCLEPRRQKQLEFQNAAKELMNKYLSEEAKKQKANSPSAP